MSFPIITDAWKLVGAAAAVASIPGSVELLTLSCAALTPRDSRLAERPLTKPWRVAVIVPAHNEETTIASCIESLLETERDGMDVDIYVIADNCSDRTAPVAAAAGAQVLVRTNESQRGKGYALDFAFTELELLGHDCVLIVDADTKVEANLIVAAAGAMRNGADGVQVRYLVRNPDLSAKARLRDLGLRAFNITRTQGRQRLGISVGLLGNGFGLRKETIAAVPYAAASVVEDLEYHLLLVDHGLRVQFVEDTAVFGEMPNHTSGIKSQRARWEGGRLSMMLRATPGLLVSILKGKGRFVEPLLELLLLPLAFHALLLLVAVSAPLLAARIVGLSGFAILLIHMLTTMYLGGWKWEEFAALLRAPVYVVWKLLLVPSLVKSASAKTAWVRTKRNAEK